MRSVGAALIALIFRMKKKATEEQAEENLNKSLRKGEKNAPVPQKPKTRYMAASNGGVFFANENTSSNYTVFYMHGGGYEHDFSPFHWRFLNKIIEKTDAMLIIPAYRLVPFGTWKDAFDLILPLYRDYAEKHPEKKIILMGDSAGGGLALSLAEQIKLDGVRMPDELVLMSPWADITMENPEIEAYKKADPWLSIPWLKVTGSHWAAALDHRAYQVSPIYGDLKGLKNATVFMGTREVLAPDIRKLFSLLDQDGANELIVGEGMNHVFPLLPIREAKQAEEIIFQKIIR